MNLDLFSIIIVILILPLIFGICARFALDRYRHSWLITAAALICTSMAWHVYNNPPVMGSELYGLRAVQTSCFAIGCLAVGIIRKKRKK